MEGFEVEFQKPSYYVRLGSLSSKVRSRAYQQALSKVRDAKVRSQETISQLNSTVNLVSVFLLPPFNFILLNVGISEYMFNPARHLSSLFLSQSLLTA